MLAVVFESRDGVVDQRLVNGRLMTEGLVGRIRMPRRSGHASVSSRSARSGDRSGSPQTQGPLVKPRGPVVLLIGDDPTLYPVVPKSTRGCGRVSASAAQRLSGGRANAADGESHRA